MAHQVKKSDLAPGLPAVVWPGGYPLYYLDGHGSGLCACCATEALEDPDPIDPKDVPVVSDVNWEDPLMICHGCGDRIPSAYAEDEPDDEFVPVFDDDQW